MKRLLHVAALMLLLAIPASAADLRDVLLTPSGRLYTAETETNDEGHFVTLTTYENGEANRHIVPDSLSRGFRSAPALAYDAESQALYVFFLRMPNILSSELLLTSYRDGKWSPTISVDNNSFRIRSNLRIAVTRKVARLQTDPTSAAADINAVVIHAVWWEQTGQGEAARYAMIAMDKGVVSNIEVHNLAAFVDTESGTATTDLNFDRELLRHPAILENGTSNSVDVFFGNIETNTFYRAPIRPIFAESRIHIPIGRAPGRGIRGPRAMATLGAAPRIDVIAAGNQIVLYATTPEAVNYVMFSNGEWTGVRSVPVSEKLSVDAAVGVLGRMIQSNE